MEPEVTALLEQLATASTPIGLKGDSIHLLSSPQEFFESLLDGIHNARSRISIAALYAGVGGGREAEFLEVLAAAAHRPSRHELKVHILMDALRSTRPCPDQNGNTISTAEALGKALLHGIAAPRTTISLFHTPLLRGLLKQALPPRVREIVGVQHVKAFVFDNDVLLTGANLSNSYFSNRQDRAILFKDSPQLAHFVTDALDTIGRFSYPLRLSKSSLRGGEGRGDGEAILDAAMSHARGVQATTQHIVETILDQCNPSGTDPVLRPWQFSIRFRRAMQELFLPPWANRRSQLYKAAFPLQALDRRFFDPALPFEAVAAIDSPVAIDWSSADTWLLPTAQAGFAGVRQEEACTLALLAHASRAGGTLSITTPYLNLGAAYERALASACPALNIELLTSSPEANGFFGSKGLSGSIPLAYSMLEQRMWRRLVRPGWRWRRPRYNNAAVDKVFNRESIFSTTQTVSASDSIPHGRRELLEYNRAGYEFHAKGAYWTPSGSALPAVTVLGSSNLGRRSLRLDLEFQAVIATQHEGLRAALGQEWAALRQYAVPVDAAVFRAPGRRSGLVKRVAVRMIRGLL